MSNSTRRRIVYASLAGGIILVGLTIHARGGFLGDTVRDMLGDALWASMIASGIGMIAPHRPAATRGVAALVVCYAVEFSQLWHTPVLDRLRASPIGPLTLGSDFDPRDLVSYALGVVAFATLDRGAARSFPPPV